MAKTTSTSPIKGYTNAGKNFTPQGYLSPSTLKRFGLKQNVPPQNDEKVGSFFTHEQKRYIKRMNSLCVTYRMLSKQCVSETKLPAPLRNGVKWFSYPLRRESGAPQPTVGNPPQSALEASS